MPRSYANTPPLILMHNANLFGGGQYRVLQPATLLRQHGYALVQAHPQILTSDVLEILKPDSVVVQFQQTDVQIEALRRYRKTLKDAFFVYEIDDLFWQVPESSVHKHGIMPDTKDRIKTAASLCDAITVTTERLAQEMRRLTNNKDIRVVPNEVPMHFINAAREGRRSANITSTKPRVGWAGGIGHTGDLVIVDEIMKLLGDEVHWVFMGMVPPDVEVAIQKSLNLSDQDWSVTKARPDYPQMLSNHLKAVEASALGLPSTIEFHPGVQFEEYGAALGALRLDVALAPLLDNPFNRCKSDLRVLEYGAAGFCVVASDVPTYADCPHILRAHSDQEWAAMVRGLIADKEVSEDLAESLHKWVVAERCMDKNLAERVKAYLPRNTVTFNPKGITPAPYLTVTVGAALEGLDNFSTFDAAWAAAPGANILYLRPDASVNPLQFARMLNVLQPGHASVSALTNDSVYPTPQQFSAIEATAAQNLDMAAMMLEDAPVQIPCPTGPCILFSASALCRYGLPNALNPDDVELSFMDWGARANEGGQPHLMAVNTYIHAGTRVIRQAQDIVTRTVQHVVGWVPSMSQILGTWVQNDPLAQVRENLELLFHRYHYDTPRPEGNTYENWIKVYDTIGKLDVEAMQRETATWENPPHINVVMPTFNTPKAFLDEAIRSVVSQTYPNWSLLIADDCSTEPHVLDDIESWSNRDTRINVTYRTENGHICKASNTALDMADTGWVIFLDHDDLLAPHALWMIAREIVQHPAVQFIFSDADKLKEDGVLDHPYFAPDFNYELLLASNYVTHISAYRIEGVKAIGGFRPGFEGSQDWDLTLRYLTKYCGLPTPDRSLIRHISHVLYHWRMSANSTAANIDSKPYALEAGRRAVLDHLRETGQNGGMVAANPMAPICTLVRFLPTNPVPLVSIIIPTKDNEKVLSNCLKSLQRTAYPSFEVIIVDNGSKDPATLRLLNETAKDKRIRVLRYPGKFNYAAMNNAAAAISTAEFICLLNDDIEIVEPAWLNDLVGLASRKGVGAVGPKLIYPNATVQQNGIFIDWTARPGGKAMHAWQQLSVTHPGQANRSLITQEYTALTGACMVIKRGLYQEFGGMDEEAFPIDYNDVDFCLRLFAKGYRNLVSAQVVMIHHEGVTKRKHLKDQTISRIVVDEARLMERHGHLHDGQWNRNLMFHPHLEKPAMVVPAKPWTVERDRVMLVNGSVDDAVRAWQDGKLPFCTTLNGHGMHVTYPAMGHVRPIDLRGPVDAFLNILGILNIPKVIFCGIGHGTLGAVGFMAAVADAGWDVDYAPTDTAEFRDPYINEDAWGAVFGQLREAQGRALAQSAILN